MPSKSPARGSPADTDLQLDERRELTMGPVTLLEALLEFDRVGNGWLWRASDHTIRIEPTEPPTVVVEASRDAGGAPESVTFSIGHVGATFIHLCRTLRIPMPRTAQKQIRLTTEGASLVLLLEASIPRRHLQAGASPVREARTVAAAAAEAVAEADAGEGAAPGAPPAAAEAPAEAAPEAPAEDAAQAGQAA